MPRGPRLDYPGALQHVIARGIERRKIFRSARDRMDLLARLGDLVCESGAALYAWVLMPNHVLCAAAHKACYGERPRVECGTCAADCVCEQSEEAAAISVIVEDLASFDSPNPDVVQSTGIIEPGGAWHP